MSCGAQSGTETKTEIDLTNEKDRASYSLGVLMAQNLKKDGYYTVAISQSPKAILDKFCYNYGFDKVYGRMYEIGPSDCFTGIVIDEHLIQNKANIVNMVFEKNDFDKTKSIFENLSFRIQQLF